MKGNIQIKNYKISNCSNCTKKTYHVKNVCSECGQYSEKHFEQTKERLSYLLNPVD